MEIVSQSSSKVDMAMNNEKLIAILLLHDLRSFFRKKKKIAFIDLLITRDSVRVCKRRLI